MTQRRKDARTGRPKDGPGSVASAARPPRRPGRETREALARRVLEILALLKLEYPDAHCELDYRTPYELLVATILSAQCTDVRVNLVTPGFFCRYPTAALLARAGRGEVEELIRSTGFFRNKAKSLIGMAQALVQRHGGEVPREMEALRVLPGVGRKTANVVLGNAFGINEGVTVDTHVARLAGLLKLTRQKTPEKIERDLMALLPREDWTLFSHLLIWHGRRVCIARRPRCAECVVSRLCPSAKLP
jgi:endonuclease-3